MRQDNARDRKNVRKKKNANKNQWRCLITAFLPTLSIGGKEMQTILLLILVSSYGMKHLAVIIGVRPTAQIFCDIMLQINIKNRYEANVFLP